jgi:hypothetical protein
MNYGQIKNYSIQSIRKPDWIQIDSILALFVSRDFYSFSLFFIFHALPVAIEIGCKINDGAFMRNNAKVTTRGGIRIFFVTSLSKRYSRKALDVNQGDKNWV